MNVIALLTDFGISDSYVGEMKGVISGIAPQAPLIDISHAIPPGDISAGALMLWRAFGAFPPGTIFLGVVDPGVGTSRRSIAARIDDKVVVCPDNGLLSYLLHAGRDACIVELKDREDHAAPISRTFHGRDIYAPAAAHLAAGAKFDSLGPAVKNPRLLPVPELVPENETVRGTVMQADHFGNLTTSIGLLRSDRLGLNVDPWCRQAPQTRLEGQKFEVILPGGAVPLCGTYADVPHGTPVAYIGSAGLLELGIRGGSAAKLLQLEQGAPIILERKA